MGYHKPFAMFDSPNKTSMDDILGIPKYIHRKRQLLGTAFGFPGGFAWALMASREAEGSWGFP